MREALDNLFLREWIKAPKLSTRTKLILVLIATVISMGLLITAIKMSLEEVNHFFDNNYLAFHRILEIDVNKPVTIEAREIVSPTVRIAYAYDGLIKESDNKDIAEYICEVFGDQCPIALAVARAESGMRSDAYNFNTNGTLDFGVMQVNSVHWGKEGCFISDLTDPYKNVDCAYKIYLSSGWGAWSAVNNGSYLTHMK